MIVGKTFVPKHLLRGGNPDEMTGVQYQHVETQPVDTGSERAGQVKAAAVPRMPPTPKATRSPSSKGYDMDACYDALNERED